GMAGRDHGKRFAQPGPRLRGQAREYRLEVVPILGTDRLRLVEELDLRSEDRQPALRTENDRIERPPNSGIPPEDPLFAFRFLENELQQPQVRPRWTPPHGMGFVRTRLVRRKWIELAGVRGRELPGREQAPHPFLVPAEDPHVQIVV